MLTVTADVQFLSQIFSICDNGWLNIWTKSGAQQWIDLSEPMPAVEVRGDADYYFGVATRKEKLSGGKRGAIHDINEIVCLWAEIDVAESADEKKSGRKYPPKVEAEALIERLPVKPSIVVWSGGGFHLYWLLREPLVNYEGKKLVEAWGEFLTVFAGEYQIDPVFDTPRVLRLPGSINQKYGGVECRVVSSIDRRYAPEDFEPFLDSPPLNGNGVNRVGKKLYEAITAGEAVDAGIRNESFASVCGRIFGMIDDLDDSENIKVAWQSALGINSSQFRPPLEMREARATFNSILARARGNRLLQDDEVAAAQHDRRQKVEVMPEPTEKLSLVLVLSDPPIFRLCFHRFANGWIEFAEYEIMRKSCVEARAAAQGQCALPQKWTAKWPVTIRELMTEMTMLDAPEETKRGHALAEAIHDYLSDVGLGRHIDDALDGDRMLQGADWVNKDGSVFFRFSPLAERLAKHSLRFNRREISEILKEVGITRTNTSKGMRFCALQKNLAALTMFACSRT